jgi:hypothetical protein
VGKLAVHARPLDQTRHPGRIQRRCRQTPSTAGTAVFATAPPTGSGTPGRLSRLPQRAAVISISTWAPAGRALTWTQERGGGAVQKYSAYTAFIAANWPMSVR